MKPPPPSPSSSAKVTSAMPPPSSSTGGAAISARSISRRPGAKSSRSARCQLSPSLTPRPSASNSHGPASLSQSAPSVTLASVASSRERRTSPRAAASRLRFAVGAKLFSPALSLHRLSIAAVSASAAWARSVQLIGEQRRRDDQRGDRREHARGQAKREQVERGGGAAEHAGHDLDEQQHQHHRQRHRHRRRRTSRRRTRRSSPAAPAPSQVCPGGNTR